MSLVADWAEPNNPSNQADYDARDRHLESTIGWFAEPLITGDYPESMREELGNVLPSFSLDESALLQGSFDCVVLDHFTTTLVR